MHTVATGSSGHLGLYRLEMQVTGGSGALRTSGLGSNAAAREAIKVGFDYFKANANRVSAGRNSLDISAANPPRIIQANAEAQGRPTVNDGRDSDFNGLDHCQSPRDDAVMA